MQDQPTGRGRVDRGRMAALFAEHHDGLLRALRRTVVADPAVLEDAAMTAWERLMRRPDVAHSATAGAWLFRVAQREAWGRARARAAELLDEHTARGVDLDEQLDVRAALRAVKPREARYLLLLAFGLSYDEIAEHERCTHTAVNRYLAEGRARARALVAA
jgi:DNA-directed RNA polymerase specialized sigma24 family protein